MPEMIDHVVVAVHDLEAASDDFRTLGFNVIPGGEHATRRSHNALVTFEDGSYIEIIAFLGAEPHDGDLWWRLLQIGEGWVDFAVYAPGLEAFIRDSGIEGLEGPLDGGRLRPDGQRLEWRTARLAPQPGFRIPFLIEDVTPRELRVPGGETASHPNGVRGVQGVTNVVRNLDDAARVYERLFGQEGQRVETDIEGAGPALRYTVGHHWIEIIEPVNPETELGQYLERRGPAPYEVVFGRGASNERGTLQPIALSHGARIRLTG